MITTDEELVEAVQRLRLEGIDSWDLEVKRASGGLPGVTETLCAFANMPEGGTLMLGLDESTGFRSVRIDASELEQGIASKARQALAPEVQVSFLRGTVDAKSVLIANVLPLPQHRRPAVVKASGRAYLRFSDGDYVLSEVEIQQILAVRERPQFDARPIDDTSVDYLDPKLTAAFVTAARAGSRRLADETDESILRRKRVLEPDGGRLTVAGLYALGSYPQQFLPSLSLTAVSRSHSDSSERNADRQEFDGSVPQILSDAVAWVVRNTRTSVRFGADGHGYDHEEIPVIAVRELIANALVHRDLSQHTSGKDVQLILDNDRLIITSPGGLWGLTTSQLGVSNVKSAVNQFLYEICQLTRTETGQRVVEGEGGGLHEVRRALRRTGMREPQFHDNGVKFTVVLPRHGLLRDEDLAWLAMLPNQDELNDIQRQILVSMRHGGTWTNQQVRDEFGPLDSRDARTYLQGLVYEGLAVARGQGRGTEYVIAGNLGSESPVSASGIALSTGTIRTATEGVAGTGVGRHGPQLMDALRGGAATRRDIQASTGLSATQVRYGLQLLLDSGHVVRKGGRGNRDTHYRVAP